MKVSPLSDTPKRARKWSTKYCKGLNKHFFKNGQHLPPCWKGSRAWWNFGVNQSENTKRKPSVFKTHSLNTKYIFRGGQIESRGLCLSRSWHKITLVLTAPGAFWIVFPGFQPSYPRYDEPSSLLRQSGCVDICSKQFGMFCTFRRHVTLHLQHGSWLRGVQS